jgi:hypothetical protein
VNNVLIDKLAACTKAAPEIVARLKATVSQDAAKLAAAQTSGKLRFDEAQGAACSSWANGVTCAQVSRSLDPSCKAAIVGLVANGSACNSGKECATGYCTADLSSSCPGTCTAKVANGGSCTDLEQCASGACSGSQCVADAPGAVGQACGHGEDPCQIGLRCDDGSRLCEQRSAAGASCGDFIGPFSGFDECAVGLGCKSPGTCQSLAGPGESCATAACGYVLYCRSSDSTCVRAPQLGDSCVQVQFCIDGSRCDGTTCVAGTVPAGGACNNSTTFCVPGLECNGLTCAAPGASACY